MSRPGPSRVKVPGPSGVVRWWQRLGLRVETRLRERHPGLWRTLIAPGVVAVTRVSTDSLGVEAGSLTYGAFLSLPPLLVLLLSIAGRVLRNDPAATQHVLDAASRAVPGLEQILGSAISVKSAAQLGLGIIGFATIVWTASGFAARSRHAFGHVFRTELTGLVFGRVLASVLGIPIVLVLVALTAAGSLTAGLRIAGSIAWITEILTFAALAIAVFAFVLLIYRLLTPGRGPTVRQHAPGSALFTAGWLVLHVIGAEYVARVVTRSTALYGAIGAIFGVLAFLYATMWWLLFCAEVTQALREARVMPLDV